MLTFQEQLLFLRQQRKESIDTINALKDCFGDRYAHVFTEKMNHNIFCYDSVLASLKELENFKKNRRGK